MADQSMSSSSASFHEPPFRYAEGKNIMYYQSIKTNLQDIQRLTNKANVDLLMVQRHMGKTLKLIDYISTNKSKHGDN